MGEVINLRQFRRQKARAERQALADERRAQFGRSKDERVKNAAEQNLERRKLDQTMREPGDKA